MGPIALRRAGQGGRSATRPSEGHLPTLKATASSGRCVCSSSAPQRSATPRQSIAVDPPASSGSTCDQLSEFRGVGRVIACQSPSTRTRRPPCGGQQVDDAPRIGPDMPSGSSRTSCTAFQHGQEAAHSRPHLAVPGRAAPRMLRWRDAANPAMPPIGMKLSWCGRAAPRAVGRWRSTPAAPGRGRLGTSHDQIQACVRFIAPARRCRPAVGGVSHAPALKRVTPLPGRPSITQLRHPGTRRRAAARRDGFLVSARSAGRGVPFDAGDMAGAGLDALSSGARAWRICWARPEQRVLGAWTRLLGRWPITHWSGRTVRGCRTWRRRCRRRGTRRWAWMPRWSACWRTLPLRSCAHAR